MCGVFANAPGLYNAGGCPGDCQVAVLNPSNYDNAYFEISYIRVFAPGSAAASASASADGSSSTSGAWKIGAGLGAFAAAALIHAATLRT